MQRMNWHFCNGGQEGGYLPQDISTLFRCLTYVGAQLLLLPCAEPASQDCHIRNRLQQSTAIENDWSHWLCQTKQTSSKDKAECREIAPP